MGQTQPKAFPPPMAQGQATNAYQNVTQSQAPQALQTPYLRPFDVNVNQSMPFMQSPNSVRPAATDVTTKQFAHPFGLAMWQKQMQMQDEGY